MGRSSLQIDTAGAVLEPVEQIALGLGVEPHYVDQHLAPFVAPFLDVLVSLDQLNIVLVHLHHFGVALFLGPVKDKNREPGADDDQEQDADKRPGADLFEQGDQGAQGGKESAAEDEAAEYADSAECR